MLPYLVELTIRLSAGIGQLPDEFRLRHAAYLRSAQRSDGGFAGREGESDLYYTGFALRGLAITGELQGEVAEQAAGFLRGELLKQTSIIDFLSLIYGAKLLQAAAGIDVFADASDNWRDAVADELEKLRREDGGYAKGAEGMRSSTYQTFLVILCLQLIEMPLLRGEAIVDFLYSQQSDEGGFREIRAQKRAGTNPTAAAVAALKILDALDDDVMESTVDFLCEMQTDEGGLRANTRIPIADLLSTFTGSLTLADLNALDRIDAGAAMRYANSMQQEEGGFHGAAWDEASDVEYSFYGLGCMALYKSDETA